MKILLVKNPTEYINNVTNALSAHEIELLEYRPGVIFNTTGKDLVILSGGGGEGFELYDKHENGDLWYRDELSFVLTCDKPLLGICMGFELIVHAYGSEIVPMGGEVKGFRNVLMKNGRIVRQYQYRHFGVKEVSPEFEILAQSDLGVEMVRHKNRPILATQFHPEIEGSTLTLEELVHAALAPAKSPVLA